MMLLVVFEGKMLEILVAMPFIVLFPDLEILLRIVVMVMVLVGWVVLFPMVVVLVIAHVNKK